MPGMPEPDTPFRRKCRMTPVVSPSNHGMVADNILLIAAYKTKMNGRKLL
jgi:hypothetical protein